jgi:PAS domain S-box-containing protein
MSWVRNTPVPNYSIDNILVEYDSVITDITESKIADLSLKESGEMLLNIINSSPDYIFVKDNDLRIVLCNEVYASAMNRRPAELIGKNDIECGWGEEFVKGDIRKGIRGYENDDLRALAGEKVLAEKEKAVIKGEIRYFDTIKTPLYKNGKITSLLGISRDITERETAVNEKKTIMDLLQIINSGGDMHDFMKTIIVFLKSWSGCGAVGIRLKEGDDYPYFETDGFPEEFVKLENSLCAYDIEGQMLRDEIGNPVIECMCGNVICGRFDPSKFFFTENGSFWSNCTTDLLRSTTDGDRQARTRNRCNGMGYESVALIPLRVGDKTFGLIQLNDKRKGMFTEDLINLFEHLGNNIAVALSEKITRKELEESEARYRLIVEKNPVSIFIVRNGKYIFANPAGAEKLGYKFPDDITGLEFEKTVSSENIIELRKRAERSMAGESNPPMELTVVKPDGTVYISESLSFPITLQDGPAIIVMGLDITEQRKLQKEIAAGFEKYRIVADLTYDWEFWIGVDGEMIYCSPSCERVTGYTKNEFMNDPLLLHGIVFPEDLNSPCLSQKDVHEFPETNETEFRITHKNGSVRWIGHSCRAVYDDAGNFNGRRGSNRDITEQKLMRIETETAMGRLDDLWNVAMHADESLQSICDFILSTIVRITKSRYGFYGFINDDETEMTIHSWSGEAMKDCSMPLKPQKYQISECGVWAVAVRERNDLIINDYKSDNPAKRGYPAGHVEIDNLMVIPVIVDGRIKSVASVANSEAGYNDNDMVNLKTFMTNIQSVIQKKLADEKVRESEMKLKALMNSTTDAAFLMTPDGIVLESNKTHADRFGVDADQLIGANAYSFLPPEVAAARKNRIDGVMKSGKPMVFEDVRDGIYLESHVYPIINDSGGISSFAVFSRDITERKESFEKINSLLKEKELLLGEVHHRIKNNMNTISGLLSLQAMSMSDSAAVTALNDARSRVQSMMIMYDKLYRSGDYRKMSLKEYLEKFIDEIFVIFENQRQVRIEKDIDDFVLETKLLFPLGIIINELITNCFKYAFPGGREGVITVSVRRLNDEINISIKDDGVGVTDKVASSGSGGFGLNLVAALTEQIGGVVKISNDNGTKVEIIFTAPSSSPASH